MTKISQKQFRALHKNFELIAEALNDAGYDVTTVLEKTLPVPWTGDLVKEQLWRPAQIAYLEKESTKDLESDEVNEVDEIIKRFLAQEFGVDSGAFPSIAQIVLAQQKD